MTARAGLVDAALARLRSAGRAFRAFLAEQDEIQQRLALINRPWEEQFLHWSGCERDDGAVLHGHLVPPGRRSLSVTRQGWCPCGARAAGRTAGARAAGRASGARASGGDQPAGSERP